MAINNDLIIQKIMSRYNGSDLTTAQAITLMVDNTANYQSNGHIEKFVFDVMQIIEGMSVAELNADFGATADSDDVRSEVLLQMHSEMGRLMVDPYSKVRDEDNSLGLQELSGAGADQFNPDGVVFRFAHMSFYEGDFFEQGMPSVVPSSLMVRRSHLSQKIETLRSPSSPVAVAQDPIESLQVDFLFPNVSSANQYLREMYSTAQCMPVFTVESPLITKAYINEVDFPDLHAALLDERLHYDRELNERASELAADAMANLDNAIELSRTDDPFVDHILERVKYEAEAIRNDETTGYGLDRTHKDLLGKISTAIGVAVKNITLMGLEEQSGAIMARITFTRANIPMLEKGQPVYRDFKGDPTYNIEDAYWLKKYCRTLLDEDTAGSRYLKPIVASDMDLLELKWENIYGQEHSARLNPETSVETTFSFTTGFKVATLPISNASSPLVQHMGRNNVEGSIVIETKDHEFVEMLSKAKAEIKKEAREGYLKQNSAEIKHPILNLLGVQRVSITDIAVQQNHQTPGLTTITLGVVENALQIADVESLVLDSGSLSGQGLKLLWEYMSGVMNIKAKLANSGKHYAFSEWYNSLDDAQKYSFNVVNRFFCGGGGENNEGFLFAGNHGIVNAALSRAMWVSRADEEDRQFFKSDAVKDMGSKEYAESLKISYDPNKNETSGGISNVIADALGAPTQRSIFARAFLRGKEYATDHTGAVIASLMGGKARVEKKGTKRVEFSDGFNQLFWDSMLSAMMKSDGDRSEYGFWSKDVIGIYLSVLQNLLNSEGVRKLVSIPDWQEVSRVIGTPASDLLSVEGVEFKLRGFLEAQASPEDIEKRNIAATNFADLVLPTYAQLFEGAVGSDGEFIWKKFAPTYSELGKRPPMREDTAFLNIDDALDLCAHEEFDLVAPGSFFYRPRVKRHALEAIEIDRTDNLDPEDRFATTVSVNSNLEQLLNDMGLDDFSAATSNDPVERRELRERVNQLLSGAEEDGTIFYDYQDFKDKQDNPDIRLIQVLSQEGFPVARYVRDADGQFKMQLAIGERNVYRAGPTDPAFDPNSQAQIDKMVQSNFEHMPDNLSNMDKSFPAIRIYLVEEDRSYTRLFDDIYSISAIESVHVTKDMNDADTAIIKLSNTSGYLSEDVFIPKNFDDRTDDEGEPFLSKFKITYGTHIVVKMGYAARPEDLKTVFTGAVAQVGGGSSITLIAQGFKTELFNNVGLFNEAFNPLDEHETSNLRSVINHILMKNGDTPHLGRVITLRDPYSEESARLYNEFYGPDSGFDKSGTWGFLTHPLQSLAERLGGKEVTDIGRNIYYDSSNSFSSEFAIPTMPAFNAIKEAVKYIPNYIVDVVPYGVDATLFVGDPNAHYKYRESTEEERRIHSEASQGSQLDAAGFTGSFTEMLEDFMDWSGFEGMKKDQRENHKNDLHLELDDYANGNWVYDADDLMDTVKGFDPTVNTFQALNDLERNIPGIKRMLFCYFFALDYNTTAWPNSFQANWKRVHELMLSPWTLKLEDEDAYMFTGHWQNLLSSLTLSGQTRTNISDERYESVVNPELRRLFESVGDVNALRNETIHATEFFGPSQAANTRGNIVSRLYRGMVSYRVFIEGILSYTQQSSVDTSTISMPRTLASEMPPGYKVFRETHIVTSEQDIIENNIVASDSEMWTAAALKAPQCVEAEGLGVITSWFEALKGQYDPHEDGNLVVLDPAQDYVLWPAEKAVPGPGNREGMTFRGDSPKAEDIIKVFFEPNAMSSAMARQALNTHLCEGMSKMYRGNLVIAGKVIKPYDVINIRDGVNKITGNFMAERVTHHFHPMQGWTTTIVPRALTHNNASFAVQEVGMITELLNFITSDEVSSVIEIVAAATLVAAFVAGTGGTGAAAVPGAVGAFMARMTARAAASRVGTAVAARTPGWLTAASTRAGSAIGTGYRGSRAAIQAMGNQAGIAGGLFMGSVVGTGLDRSIGAHLRQMHDTAMHQKLGGDAYPILVNTLAYHNRPYTAGFKPNEYDFNTEFWKNFSLIMSDAGKGISNFFERQGLPGEPDKTTREILGNE